MQHHEHPAHHRTDHHPTDHREHRAAVDQRSAHGAHRGQEANAAGAHHAAPASLNRLAVSATLHCLTGCGIGEVLGLVVGTALEWGNGATTALAIVLAFAFGYALTMLPLLRAGLTVGAAAGLALASDTASITIMEIVDSAIMLAVPGAMEAGLGEFRFWGSLALALAVAGAMAFPVNRWLIARGRGHAVVHRHHAH
jgi:hypothetical protein